MTSVQLFNSITGALYSTMSVSGCTRAVDVFISTPIRIHGSLDINEDYLNIAGVVLGLIDFRFNGIALTILGFTGTLEENTMMQTLYSYHYSLDRYESPPTFGIWYSSEEEVLEYISSDMLLSSLQGTVNLTMISFRTEDSVKFASLLGTIVDIYMFKPLNDV